MDVGDFDFDDGTAADGNAVTQAPHVKREFDGIPSATTDVATTSTLTIASTTAGLALKRLVNNRSKNQPLIEPTWVALKDLKNVEVFTTKLPSTTTTMAAVTTGDDLALDDAGSDGDNVTDAPDPVVTTEVKMIMQKKTVLTEQQRSRLAAAEQQQQSGAGSWQPKMDTTAAAESTTPSTTLAATTVTTTAARTTRPTRSTTTTTTTTTVVATTTPAADVEEPESEPEVAATTTAAIVDHSSSAILAAADKEKRQEAAASRLAQDAARSIDAGEGGAQRQNVASLLLSASQKALQMRSLKLAPSVDKGANTTGLERVAGADSPLLDGSYLSDPWMCRSKRDVIKSPVRIESTWREQRWRVAVSLRVTNSRSTHKRPKKFLFLSPSSPVNDWLWQKNLLSSAKHCFKQATESQKSRRRAGLQPHGQKHFFCKNNFGNSNREIEK